MNYTLLWSSIYNGLLLLITALLYKDVVDVHPGGLLLFILSVSVLTSIWNHGASNAVARWCDRIAVVVGGFVDLYCIYEMPDVALLSRESNLWHKYACTFFCFVGVFFFFLAKRRIMKNLSLAMADRPHLYEHVKDVKRQPPFSAKICQITRNLPHLLCHLIVSLVNVTMIVRIGFSISYPVIII